MPRAFFNGSRADLDALLRRLPAVLSGAAPDAAGIARGLQLRLGVALLSKVQQDFVTKSRGGVGEDGIKWPSLRPASVAQRRTTAGERKAAGVGGKRTRGLLTPAQDQRWRRLFASRKARLEAMGMGPREASARAAQSAWAILKAEGAKTRLAVFGSRTVDTLRDTGELFRSFSPGVGDTPSGADGQVFDVQQGRVIVGTNKKPWHHTGIPGKLPARPFWPADGRLPRAWWEHLLGVYSRGLARAVVLLAERGRA